MILAAILTAAVFNLQADVDLSNSTIYLSEDGKAYENNSGGQDITAQVAAMGLAYNATYSKWYMTEFTFTTTASKGLDFGGASYDLFIVVQGDNKIEVNCTDTNASVNGINAYALDTIMGSCFDDKLEVNTSNSTGFSNSPFSVDMSGATVYNMTLVTKAGYGRNYSKGFKVNNALIVDHAAVTFEGGETLSETFWSVGYQGGDSLVLKNQSTFRAFTEATTGLKFGAVISDPKAAVDTMYATGTADALTLSQYETTSYNTFYNGSEIATDVTNVKTEPEPSAVEDVMEEKAVEVKKYMINGQLFIERNGVTYDAQGRVVRR